MTDSEIAVIRHLLPIDDWRSDALLAQATGCLGVERRQLSLSSASMTIPAFRAVTPLANLTLDCVSPWLVVTLTSGRQARFRLDAYKAGCLGPLIGEMVDGGPWVKWFEVEPRSFPSEPPENWLTPRMEPELRNRILERLKQWVGSEPGTLTKLDEATLWVSPPATDSEIAQVEAANKARLPDVYKSLLQITNGLRHAADDFWIAGTDELETLDLEKEHPIVWRFCEHYQLDIFGIDVGLDATAVARIEVHGETESWMPFHEFISRILDGQNNKEMDDLVEKYRSAGKL